MKKDYICVFDCETIPDVAALVRVLDEDAIADCFEPFDKKSFAKLLDAQLSQKIGGEKQSAPLNFAVNSAEQNFKIENSEQNSAPQNFTQQDAALQNFASENSAENLAEQNFIVQNLKENSKARNSEQNSASNSTEQNFASQNTASKNSASLNLTYDDIAPQSSAAQSVAVENSALRSPVPQNFAAESSTPQSSASQSLKSENLASNSAQDPALNALNFKIYGEQLIFNADKSKILNHKLLSLRAMEIFKEKTGSEFLPVCFHRVVSISAVMADGFGRFLRVSTLEGENERDKIAKFLAFIEDFNPRLVSFNGRGFDLPMIMARAMCYDLSAAAYFETNDRDNNKSKWENYRSRYDGRFHLDLLDHISDFGAVRGLKLDHICASVGLPGKYDVHGDQVLQLYYAGEQTKIDEYCRSDVLNTYWLFLKYELLRGKITKDDYLNYIAVMGEFLQKECAQMSYTPVFCDFIEKELAAYAK
ncbi:3'-5' exonuclease [uncultured Campylobacter sp.]|uniref:3'-5' exonuclease n=1 Tax=uncultured Campylobacter sp. TaxID=218934 RepID=UPI002612271F|nr:3'-5' exonuclease [uncultured Campylobacter sp.]